MTKNRLLEILKQILSVEDVEVKNYALESLIEEIEEEKNDSIISGRSE